MCVQPRQMTVCDDWRMKHKAAQARPDGDENQPGLVTYEASAVDVFTVLIRGIRTYRYVSVT